MNSNLAQVAVTFNPVNASRRVTFGPRDQIEFDNNASGTVTFSLEVTTALQVRFPSTPIQWVRKINEEGEEVDENLRPIDPPPGVTVSRRNDTTAEVTIGADPSSVTKTFRFYVIVQTTDGRFFGSDPTIVTMRPGEGTTPSG